MIAPTGAKVVPYKPLLDEAIALSKHKPAAVLMVNRGLAPMHLQPVFGAVLAVLLLGEQFFAFHAVGVLLIGAGIALSTWTAKRA